MVQVNAEIQHEYQEAWDAWQRHLQRLHEVFLEEAAIDPPQLKGLLNREARAKKRYDGARQRLLGIPGDPGGGSGPLHPPGPPGGAGC